MARRVIDRAEWTRFLDGYSNRHEAWLISIAVDDGRGPCRYLARSTPLRGITAEMGSGRSTIVISTGHKAPHSLHFVRKATSLQVEETEEGAESSLTIGDGSGVRTTIGFRSPMPTGLVDGFVR